MSNDFGGKKRSELPDEVFGIPQERKYPMPDEKHTRSAIKLFNHVEPKYEEQLAKAVIKNMKKYNIDGSVVGPNNRLRKYLPKDTIQEDYVYETAIQDFKTPEELSEWMRSNIRYKQYTKLMSPDEVYEQKRGSCHDQVMFELHCLRKMKMQPKALFIIEYNEGGKGTDNVTHSLVYYTDKNKICWFENAWGGQEGIHKFNSLTELKNKLKYLHDNGKFGNNSKYPLLEITSFKSHKPGESLQELVDIAVGESTDLSIYSSERIYDQEYANMHESSRTSYFSYSGIKTSEEKSEFKRNFREVFKEDPTESSINNMQMIKYKESLVGYIGFSRYTIDKKKYLGIGNFMIIKKYQHRGIGSKVISDIIDKYKDKYDEIYCYVDENNTNAISFYKKIAKVDTENLTRYGYYVSLYRKNKSSIKEETRIEDNKLPKHIYHISYVNHDGETFEPRTYDNDNVKNGMERKVKRVCFSDSVTRALYSIFPNGAYDADFYVHVPNSDCKVYKTTSDDIYDADITHELWIKEPVQMKCIGKIHVNGVSDKTHTIDVDKDKAGYGKKKYHETRWKWVEKYEKDETLYESYISEDDDMINEGGYIFTIKILPIALKSMFRTNQYDYKWVREEYLPKIVNKCSTVEEVAYLRRDANSAIGQLEAIKINIKGILDNDEKIMSRLSPSFIKKVQQGKVTVKDVDEHIRFLKGPYKKMLNDKYKEIKNKSVKESSISEYGATAGTMVGSNQPDSVYIVNYMQNNVFSGYKEPRFGICKKGMKDFHVLGDKDKKLHHVSDRDKFKEEASDIKIYRYRGKPKHTFYDIIENTTDNDKDIYKLITGRDIENRKDIDLDEEFVREECFWDELDAIKSCTEATILDQAEDLHEIPILTETVQGRPYNYYRDINGVFVQNEITKIRSKSYDSIDDIPLSEIDIIKRGYLV